MASLLRATAPLAPHPVNALLNGNLLPPQTIVACISACVFCLYILMAVSVSMCIYILSAFGCSKSETNRHLQAIYASHPIPPKTVLRSNITDYVRCYTNYEPRSMRNMTLSSLVLSGLQPGEGLQNSGAGTGPLLVNVVEDIQIFCAIYHNIQYISVLHMLISFYLRAQEDLGGE